MCDLSAVPSDRDGHVDLVEERVEAHLGLATDAHSGVWYLDTGANNHMSGEEASFSELDRHVTGTVKFGDRSVVDIRGRGSVLFTDHAGGHRVLSGVYFIPRLKSNIISIGQLDQTGCRSEIEHGVFTLYDQQRRIMAKVQRAGNRLYPYALQLARPVCLAARCATDEAWKWHARYGHLNFQALRKLAQQGLVRGLPSIDHIDQVCDGCLAGKQRCASFPAEANYRAEQILELVHGDLCGPITPATAGGRRYFLLVDDMSRYMWLSVLRSKDEAAGAIARFQARVETETGRRLRALRTDRGGEFTSVDFSDYCADRGVQRQLTVPYSSTKRRCGAP